MTKYNVTSTQEFFPGHQVDNPDRKGEVLVDLDNWKALFEGKKFDLMNVYKDRGLVIISGNGESLVLTVEVP